MAELEPREAWEKLRVYREKYYRQYIAAYNGDEGELRYTSTEGMFWARDGKAKLHVPIGADIAQVSADLLFGQELSFSAYDEETEANGSAQQARLDKLVSLNDLTNKLVEAAESCAALGDVYLKLNWWQNEMDYPVVSVVQGDAAYSEYVMGRLNAVHFFSVLRRDYEKDEVLRLYELYEKGKIFTAIFRGSSNDLGAEAQENALSYYGLEREVQAPVNELLAIHIPNMRPNRLYRDNYLGRSDFDQLRGLMDSLDEAYSSWMRDIRLAKARLIVPAEYLRRRSGDMFRDGQYTYEFDEDVETLVALDIDPDRGGSTITSSQFAIRSAEHAATCAELIRNIVSIAGYAPQSFGLDISGMAQSGTALQIRQQKSYNTLAKKQTYWKSPLEKLLTSMIHLDAALYPGAGSDSDDEVKIRFADSSANDISTLSSALQMLNSASAISTQLKVQMLHPDWTQQQIAEEVERVKTENGIGVEAPAMDLGDYERPQE